MAPFDPRTNAYQQIWQGMKDGTINQSNLGNLTNNQELIKSGEALTAESLASEKGAMDAAEFDRWARENAAELNEKHRILEGLNDLHGGWQSFQGGTPPQAMQQAGQTMNQIGRVISQVGPTVTAAGGTAAAMSSYGGSMGLAGRVAMRGAMGIIAPEVVAVVALVVIGVCLIAYFMNEMEKANSQAEKDKLREQKKQAFDYYDKRLAGKHGIGTTLSGAPMPPGANIPRKI